MLGHMPLMRTYGRKQLIAGGSYNRFQNVARMYCRYSPAELTAAWALRAASHPLRSLTPLLSPLAKTGCTRDGMRSAHAPSGAAHALRRSVSASSPSAPQKCEKSVIRCQASAVNITNRMVFQVLIMGKLKSMTTNHQAKKQSVPDAWVVHKLE